MAGMTQRLNEIVLSFGLPPSLNRLYRKGKRGIYMSEEGRAYKQEVALMAVGQMEKAEPLLGKVGVELRFYGARMDADNMTKALFDSLNGIVWGDDRQIIELHIYKLPNDGDPRVDVCVWPIQRESIER